MTPTILIRPEWGLTGQEGRVLQILAAHESGATVSKTKIMDELYGAEADEPDPKIIDVFVCKARKKLARFNITIETIWGVGYRLARETHAALLAQLADAA